MSTHEIESKIRELRQLQALIDEAQTTADSIRDDLKSIMGENTELYAGEYKITWKHIKGSRLDTAALKKAAPELVAAFTKEITTRRFCVAIYSLITSSSPA